MTESPRANATHLEPSPFAEDALVFTRIGGAEAVAFFQAADEHEAARALLRSYPVPVGKQSTRALARRVEECSQALPDQNIPGYSESIRAATVLQNVFMGAVALVALWAVIFFFIGDPNAAPVVFPAEIIFLPVEEILMLAPFALLPFYIPFLLASRWKARTSAQAVLRWAAGGESTRKLGIPAKSPFFEIKTAWEGLQYCAGAVVAMDLFLAVFFFAVRESDESIGLVLLPVLCALPFAALYLICGRRVLAAQRRHALVADRLFRLPSDQEMSLPESVSLEGLVYPMDGGKAPARGTDDDAEEVEAAEELDLETSFEDTEWKTSFSSRTAPSDHLARRDRPERREG